MTLLPLNKISSLIIISSLQFRYGAMVSGAALLFVGHLFSTVCFKSCKLDLLRFDPVTVLVFPLRLAMSSAHLFQTLYNIGSVVSSVMNARDNVLTITSSSLDDT